MSAACRMGRFVAAVPNAAASANIVGKLEIGKDGGETVLQRKGRPSSHIHFRPEAISEFAFTFVDPGFGAQPCLELRTRDGAAALRLYYQGKKVEQRFSQFMERAAEHAGFVTGTWLGPNAAHNEDIFVADETAEEDTAEDAAQTETANAPADENVSEGRMEEESTAGTAEVVNAS